MTVKMKMLHIFDEKVQLYLFFAKKRAISIARSITDTKTN